MTMMTSFHVMNFGKVETAIYPKDSRIGFLAVTRYIFIMPFRQLEGFARALSRLIHRLPYEDYSKPCIYALPILILFSLMICPVKCKRRGYT